VRGVDKPAEITRALAGHDLYVSELVPVTVDLESVFLELTATAPVPGQHRQVDQSAQVGPAPSGSGPVQGGWGV
jgi:ABC-2 type transport system ATP-binding protein